ncbi:MAG: SDR family NAD(P)-dependent oxidoreductase [Pseudomonadota bacterium]|nr:SDR family NAD(P)-dependent oxidoreductase [Pseudomonadota bacterium]
MHIAGKKITLTGATGGIGKALLSLLGSAADIQLIKRDTHGDLVDNLETICLQIQAFDPDIIIHLAGFNEFALSEDQHYNRLIDVNLRIPMEITQRLLPQLKRKKQAQIVFIGSMMGLIPMPYYTGYVAAKAGLKGYADSLRRELRATQITITHVVPRAVDTSMNTAQSREVHSQTGVKHDTPEAVAQIILNAIEHKKREVRIGFPERLFAIIQSLFPRLIDSGLSKNNRVSEQVLEKRVNQS